MSMRTSRVEQTLRRALADILLRGDLRDPRLRHAAAISITAVKIAPDLGSALVYVDVLGEEATRQQVLEGLNAAASALRSKLGGLIRLKRTPSLRFVTDQSIEQGRKIEAVLAELHAQRSPIAAGAGDETDPAPAEVQAETQADDPVPDPVEPEPEPEPDSNDDASGPDDR